MKISFEVIISLLILSILAVFLNPTKLLMPESITAMLILILIVGFLVFFAIIWREQANDERESLHIQKAGRISFLVGSAILVTGVTMQATNHNVDPWLLYALSGMVFTKLASRIFHHFKN